VGQPRGRACQGPFLGGEIERAGAGIALVQLRLVDGRVVEDDPTHDIALFIINEPVKTPATIVLLDHAGGTVAEHEGFPDI
jgi:hypothetical protein